MNERQRLLKKVRAIKAIAEDPRGNENEKAAAFDQLAKLLTKYDIDQSELDADSGLDLAEGIVERTHHGGQRISEWRQTLHGCLCDALDCQPILRSNYKGRFLVCVGFQHDVEVVEYLFETLSRALQKSARKWWDESYERRCGISLARYRNGYINGAAYAVKERIIESRKKAQQESDCTALVVQKSARVDQFLKDNYNLSKGRAKELESVGGREGYDAGKRIPLTPGVASTGKATQQLGA